jgi:hypothetical protein
MPANLLGQLPIITVGAPENVHISPALGTGGTPSVVPLGAGICISSGRFPTITVFDAHSGGGATTVRQGFEPGEGGTGQAMIEPITSVSLSAGAPPIVTVGSFGITVTFPMCTQVMTAFAFSAGNGIATSIVAVR